MRIILKGSPDAGKRFEVLDGTWGIAMCDGDDSMIMNGPYGELLDTNITCRLTHYTRTERTEDGAVVFEPKPTNVRRQPLRAGRSPYGLPAYPHPSPLDPSPGPRPR
jgi:hypothetical protein